MNIKKLRQDIIDYYGTAAQIYPQAILEISKIKNASDEQLIIIAEQIGIDLTKYKTKGRS